MEMVGELGLRYPPGAQADMEAHKGRLALLARDLADVPWKLLRRAVDDWAQRSPYLPKASDLIDMCKGYVTERQTMTASDIGTRVQQLNSHLGTKPRGREIEWYVASDGTAKLRWITPGQ